jgi:hypothetical protein
VLVWSWLAAGRPARAGEPAGRPEVRARALAG